MSIYINTINDLKPFEATLDRYRRDPTDSNPNQHLLNLIVDAHVRLGQGLVCTTCATDMAAAASWVANWYFNNKHLAETKE